jgi:hypothetical protein
MKGKETGLQSPAAGAMNEDRIRLLEELGFSWTIRGGVGAAPSVDAGGIAGLGMEYAQPQVAVGMEESSRLDGGGGMVYYDDHDVPTVGHHDELETIQHHHHDQQHDPHHSAELMQQSMDEAVLAMQQAAERVANETSEHSYPGAGGHVEI